MKRMSHFAGSRRGGMTLMEILVAVSVLSIIIVGFGQVLTQARRTVSTAQLKMKQLQHVRAIRECFTKDLGRVSKNGFLYITSNKLVLTAAGESIGRVANTANPPQLAQGNASVIVYGRGGNNLLLRKAFVLDESMSTSDDHIAMDFSALQKMSKDEMDTEASNRTVGTVPAFPPTTASGVKALWPVIAPKITGLTIEAGKRMVNGTISWDVAVWRKELLGATVFDALTNTTLWTRHNQTDWPDLIKITITITDKKLAELMDRDNSSGSVTYEIICPIR